MPSTRASSSSSARPPPPLFSPTEDTTIASVSSHTVDQRSSSAAESASSSSASSSSSSSSSSDSSSDDDEEDDDDPLDSQTRQQMKALLLKARQAACSQGKKGEGKAVQDDDALANNEEVITFGDEQDDETSDDDADDEDDDDDEPKASTSNASVLPKSLVAPLKVNRGLNTTSKKPVRSDNRKPETAMREFAIANASKFTSGKVIKGDKWGMMPMKSLSKKELKARHPPTAGPSWFNMPAPTMTPQLKREVQAMRLRNALDPKRFYRGDAAKADSKLPEFFQVGHVLNESQRATNAEPIGKVKKRSFVEELIEDEQAKAYTKRKTLEVMRKGMSGRKGKAKRRKV
ncbi:BQ2448_7757 [Microbotryum intermedium]|uniref:BQ2448_7757 protein n=1 Tax=Microbotryum intermedium TaxID=269621 RepID=A0A238FU30_9BASI|nr:BQ2448_7757 [Microbotryum intermedium]